MNQRQKLSKLLTVEIGSMFTENIIQDNVEGCYDQFPIHIRIYSNLGYLPKKQQSLINMDATESKPVLGLCDSKFCILLNSINSSPQKTILSSSWWNSQKLHNYNMNPGMYYHRMVATSRSENLPSVHHSNNNQTHLYHGSLSHWWRNLTLYWFLASQIVSINTNPTWCEYSKLSAPMHKPFKAAFVCI